MIIVSDRKFVAASFDNEGEIERVVIENAEYIFGPDSIMLPKSLIKSAEGFGTIPDGFAIDFASRRWFIVEAELSAHSVWGHIAPQVSKQIVAAQQPASRKLLLEVVITLTPEGNMVVEGKAYSAPSFAALYYIQKAGSSRNTVNGWTSWRTEDGRVIADLRTELLDEQRNPNKAVHTNPLPASNSPVGGNSNALSQVEDSPPLAGG